ncbi:MAG TPA: response regulator [Candidatus Saccharimonadales bacterium]
MAKRILIVEDERPLAHALELKLAHEGFQVKVAGDGQQAMDDLEQEDFDVILLDMMMPVMDGFQVLDRLRKRPHRPTVFVLSNLSQREDESRVLEAGAKKYFIKSDTPLSVIIEEVKQA